MYVLKQFFNSIRINVILTQYLCLSSFIGTLKQYSTIVIHC